MGDTGPCGRCSEIHYFRGNDLPCSAPTCLGPACDCDRFVEIWNNVFMEFDRQPGGALLPLPKPSIDTGMGLERIAAVKKGTLSNYDTDAFTPLLIAIEAAHGGATPPSELATSMAPAAISTRVVADHLRAMTFLIADGVLPSNEWRGYVLRKIMRRAMRHGKRLGFAEPVLHVLADELVAHMGDAYPELRSGRDTIVQVIRAEEHRFDAVLTNGLPKLEELLERAAQHADARAGRRRVPALRHAGSAAGLHRRPGQRAQAGARRAGLRPRDGGAARESARAAAPSRASGPRSPTFEHARGGRAAARVGGTVRGLHRDARRGRDHHGAPRRRPAPGHDAAGRVVGVTCCSTARRSIWSPAARSPTPGDLRNEAGTVVARVEGVVRLGAGLPRGHKVTVTADALDEGQTVTAHVDERLRDATRRNHTATHLMHAALRQVLGTHVKQAGSLVAPDRLRFDFTHFSPVTSAQLARDRGAGQRADPAQRPGDHGSERHRGGDGVGRDGACLARSTATACAW